MSLIYLIADESKFSDWKYPQYFLHQIVLPHIRNLQL